MARWILYAIFGLAAFHPDLRVGHLIDTIAPKIVEVGETALERSGCLLEEEMGE